MVFLVQATNKIGIELSLFRLGRLLADEVTGNPKWRGLRVVLVLVSPSCFFAD